MRCVIDADLRSYADVVLPWLLGDPVVNNVACTVIRQRLDGTAPVEPDALWIRVLADNGDLAGVAFRTPPRGLLLTGMPAAAAESLARHLVDLGVRLTDADGPAETVAGFASRYAALAGLATRKVMGQRLYRLDRVRPPAGVAGRLRQAVPADRDLLVAWSAAGIGEVHPDAPPYDPAEPVDRRIGRDGLLWVWEDAGQPVSMAWLSPAAAGVVRVSGVYTPAQRRRRGYASGCVAAVSQVALERGAAACMLYTDLDNPTTNTIYQRIGYRPVAESGIWRFTA
jgi:predicted GNAT family acetyltransferase